MVVADRVVGTGGELALPTAGTDISLSEITRYEILSACHSVLTWEKIIKSFTVGLWVVGDLVKRGITIISYILYLYNSQLYNF